jgi:hypothetical protein
MTYSTNLSDHPEDSTNKPISLELPLNPQPQIRLESPIIQNHGEQIEQLRKYLEYLSQGHIEILEILYQQQELKKSTKPISSDIIERMEAISTDINSQSKLMMATYKYLEKNNLSKEIIAIKTEQGNLCKVFETNQKKTNNNVSLDWRKIAVIITSTAMLSSLCSLAVFQVSSNWKTNQPQNPVEKPLKPKSKKDFK